MRKHYIPLNNEEVGYLLGVWSMYGWVPFYREKKRTPSRRREAACEAVWHRLLSLRDAASGGLGENDSPLFLPLEEQERTLYLEMARACLVECGDDGVSLRLHLAASCSDKVENLINKLQSAGS